MKINYLGMQFDSELEVEYCKYLEEELNKGNILWWTYHPSQIPNLVGKRSYTPDFIVLYKDRAEIVETKGYNPYSVRIDDAIHQAMLCKTTNWIYNYILDNVSSRWKAHFVNNVNQVAYKKLKYLKAYGFVDWDFKNPNTIANKRKEKILTQKDEIKELKEFKKNAERYFTYHLKLVNKEKLTKTQKEWYCNYVEELKKNYGKQ